MHFLLSLYNSTISILLSLCYYRSMSLPIRQLEAERTSTKDKNRGGSPVETSVFYDEREDSNTGFSAT